MHVIEEFAQKLLDFARLGTKRQNSLIEIFWKFLLIMVRKIDGILVTWFCFFQDPFSISY